MPKKSQKPNLILTLDIDPNVMFNNASQPIHKATVVAKQGDLGYVAEIELANWSEDIAALFQQMRTTFFDAETNGLPEFPDMNEAQPAEEDAEPEEQEPESVPDTNEEAFNDDEYDITLYEPHGTVVDDTPTQNGLWEQ